MLRFLGELAVAPVRALRLLRGKLKAVVDVSYRRERDSFIEMARLFVPWLTPSRLTYLAYHADEVQTKSSSLWKQEREADRTRWIPGHGLTRVFAPFSVFARLGPDARPYERPDDLLRLGCLHYFKPEPVWIRKTIRTGKKKKTRTLHIPNVVLKQLLRFVLHAFLKRLQVNTACYGFEVGRSRREHARNHCGKAIVLRLDLRDFFPSIRAGQLGAIFREAGFRTRFAGTLAQLVTYRGRLPQGAPTSPKLADLVARPLDRALRDLATERRWYYSRYADDLCFSHRRALPRSAIDAFIAEVRGIVRSHGFSLNEEKTRVMMRHRRQLVAGVVVNGRTPAVPRERRRLLRALLHNSRRRGLISEGERYRNSLAARGMTIAIQDGRRAGEKVRSDRLWPYAKQVPFLPRSVQADLVHLRDEQWTAVADFWHYLCGSIGEVSSVSPEAKQRLTSELAQIKLYPHGGISRIQSSLEVRVQSVSDLWRQIADAVSLANEAHRALHHKLVDFQWPTPPVQRLLAENEGDFKIFVGDSYNRLVDAIEKTYKKQVLDSHNALARLTAIRHSYFHHVREERLINKAREAFHSFIHKPLPQAPGDWYQAQVEILKAALADIRALQHWHPPDTRSR